MQINRLNDCTDTFPLHSGGWAKNAEERKRKNKNEKECREAKYNCAGHARKEWKGLVARRVQCNSGSLDKDLHIIGYIYMKSMSC